MSDVYSCPDKLVNSTKMFRKKKETIQTIPTMIALDLHLNVCTGHNNHCCDCSFLSVSVFLTVMQ